MKFHTAANVEGPVKTAWDSWYPLNRVLNHVLLPDDFEKAITMGFSPTLAAMKTYGMWRFLFSHLAESTFRKAVEEYDRCEHELNRVRQELRLC